MSFWTGFTTGLASSVDKGLQKAIEKRDGELSSAKKMQQNETSMRLKKKRTMQKHLLVTSPYLMVLMGTQIWLKLLLIV